MVPMPVLTTERLRLDPIGHEDADELLRLFRDPGVREYLLDDVVVPSEWVADEITASADRFASGGAGLWAARLHDDERIIGFGGYRPFFEPPQLQLLYALLPEFWHRGLATELGRRLCAFGFDEVGFDRIRAAIDTPHDASRHVLERLGFAETHRTPEGAQGTTFFALDRPRDSSFARDQRPNGE